VKTLLLRLHFKNNNELFVANQKLLKEFDAQINAKKKNQE
jgi:hypothetical protein